MSQRTDRDAIAADTNRGDPGEADVVRHAGVPQPDHQHAGRAIAAIVTCQLMLMVDGVIVTVALPSIRTELHLGTVGLSWVLSAYALAFAGFLLVSGRIGTLVGPRRAMVIGVGVFVAASAAGGLAPNGELLIAARAVQGAGAAFAGPAVLVLIIANTDEGASRLRGMSWFIIASSAGSAVGLIAGGVLTVTVGWRWVMLVNVPIGALVIAGTLAFVREPSRGHGRLDLVGAVCSALAMIGLVYGLTRSAESGWTSTPVLVWLGVAGVALIALVIVESRVSHPVVPLRLLAGSRRAVPYLGMLLMPAAMIGFFYFSVLALQEVRGLNALQTGLAYLPWAAAVVIGGRIVPRLLSRIGERATVCLGVLAAITGTVAFARLATHTPLWLGVLLPCLITGFGPALFFTAVNNRIMADAPPTETGAAAGLLQSLQQLGGAVGVAALTTVYSRQLGHAQPGHTPAQAIVDTVLASAVFGLVLLVLALATPAFSPRGRTPEPAPSSAG